MYVDGSVDVVVALLHSVGFGLSQTTSRTARLPD